jgi:hypothetical protein
LAYLYFIEFLCDHGDEDRCAIAEHESLLDVCAFSFFFTIINNLNEEVLILGCGTFLGRHDLLEAVLGQSF